MFNYSSNGVSLSLIRDVRKKDSAKDDCPLRWRVTFQRKQVYFSTGILLSLQDWELLNDKKCKVAKIRLHRETLQTYYDSTIHKIIKALAESGTFSFESINVRLNKSVGTDMKQMFNAKIQNLIADDKIGNSIVYQCTLRSIEMFTSKNILFTDITPKWLEKYEKSMVDKNQSYSTIGMYLRTLRAIVNEAKTAKLINDANYPFGREENGKYVIPSGGSREAAVEPCDIKKIAEYNCPTKTIEMCRDLWLFSFLANGANFGDICRFKFSDIENNEISFFRKKTKGKTKKKVKIVIPILEPLQTIIDKWGNEPTSNGFIFPFLNGCSTEAEYYLKIKNIIRLTNNNIKKVATELELPEISTNWCRHSYQTILAKARVPESYIAEAVGHAESSVTRGYIGRYNKQERITYNSLLLWSI